MFVTTKVCFAFMQMNIWNSNKVREFKLAGKTKRISAGKSA